MAIETVGRPDESEHGPDFGTYVRLTPDGDIQTILETQLTEMLGLLGELPEAESLVRHAPYAWTIRQVVGHLTDCERIFGYRALRIGRGDATPLAGFDENQYMQAVDFDRYPLAELVREFEHVRRSHLLLLRHLEPAAWLRRGVVRDGPASTRAFAYVMAGHAKHHLDIVRQRLANR
jgi:hypothetical protein